MKKLIIIAVLMLTMGIAAQAQNNNETTITKQGKVFTATKTKNNAEGGAGYSPTGYTYIDTDGKVYEIHLHTTQKGKNKGVTRCYIQRISKETGKPYWKVIDVKPEQLKED